MNNKNHCGCSNDNTLRRECSDTDDYLYTGLSPLPADAAVTMAYVPFQTDRRTYDAETALCNGTLFPSLNKPFLGACRK